jgi:hypothetical protein
VVMSFFGPSHHLLQYSMQTRSEAKRTMASRFDPHRAAVKGVESRLRNTGYMPQSSPYQNHRRRMAGAGARISRASSASPDARGLV